MAQILTWDIKYTPTEQPWSVVRCESRKTIEDYLTTGSVILLHPDRFGEHRLFFILVRMRMPQTAIAVIGGEHDLPELIDNVVPEGIEDYIRSKMVCEVGVENPRHDIAVAESFLRGCDSPKLLLIFDMDGTLVRSDGFTYEAMKLGFEQVYREEGIERSVPSYEELIPRLGLGKGSVYRHFLPETSHHREDDLRNLVRANIRELLESGEGDLFPGVETMLNGLLNHCGITMALVSNSPAGYFYSVVERFRLERFFKAILCLGDRPSKTKSDMIREMQERFNPLRTVMVGDRYIDIDSGKECGCYTIGCAYGFGLEGELDSADRVIERFDQIAFLIKE